MSEQASAPYRFPSDEEIKANLRRNAPFITTDEINFAVEVNQSIRNNPLTGKNAPTGPSSPTKK